MPSMSDKCMNIKPMDMENFTLTTEIFYKVNLKMEGAKEKEDGSKLMAAIMKEILKTMSQMDMGSISI